MTNLLAFVAIVPLLLVPLVNAQNNTILQNQTNPYHLRHFHVLSTAEKTQIKKNCIESGLYQIIIAAVIKHYLEINDSASTAAIGGPIYTINPTFFNDSAAALLDCVNK